MTVAAPRRNANPKCGGPAQEPCDAICVGKVAHVDVDEFTATLAALEEARQLYSPLAVWSRVFNGRVGDTHINLSYSPF